MILRETLERMAGGGASLPAGLIVMYGGSSAPSGWLLCDGTSYLRASYPTLFTAIGTAFGSVDSTHFNVPDMRTRFPRGLNTGDTLGATGGSDTINIAHTHTVNSHTHTLSHTHTVNSHTHSIPSHTHNQGTLYAKVTGGSGAIYFTEDGTSGSWTASKRVTGTYGSGSYSVSGGADVVGSTGSWSGTSGGATPGTGGASNTTTSGATPGTDSQLSSAQSIIPKYVNLNYIIKV